MLDNTPQRVCLNRLLALVLSSAVTRRKHRTPWLWPITSTALWEPRIVLTKVIQRWYGVDDDVIDYTGFDYDQMKSGR